METILIRYAELRRAADQVQGYLTGLAWWEEPYGLHLRLEEDLGLGGLDTKEFLTEFGARFQVDLSRFDFSTYISPEPGTIYLPGPLQWLFSLPVYLLIWASCLLVAAICLPFSRRRAQHFWQRTSSMGWPTAQPVEYSPGPYPLCFGDLVASAAVGRFVKREAVRFVLQRA